MPRTQKTPEEKEYLTKFGERLKYARTRRTFNFEPMSRKQLSEISGISEWSIRNYEKGIMAMGIFTLRKLIKALRIDIKFLLYGEKKRNNGY